MEKNDRKAKTDIKERFMQAIQKDPYLVGIIMNIKVFGINEITDYGTIIVKYHNRKTGITTIIDPAKPTIFIKENNEPEGFNISIRLAIQTTIETFGIPEVTEIPKFGGNLLPLLNGPP